ncbi:MAG: lipoyl synthase [Thermotogota bacterium]|nr:lipoyl synthase [Thermotogota bacterium]
MKKNRKRLPEWLRHKNLFNQKMIETRKVLKEFELHSVCQSARCPNIGECFANKTAAFMILGDVCTRNCRFCAVKTGYPGPIDDEEPVRLARAVGKLGLRHVVITSVTRDDLPDGGAEQFIRTIENIHKLDSKIIIEILTPDFKMNRDAIKEVVAAGPNIYNHNVETVPRLYSRVRPEANYQRSLSVLKYVKELNDSIYTKSGIMVGLGEKEDEVVQVMKDLRSIDCDIFTIGQYLQPTRDHLPVVKYIEPEKFDRYKDIGRELGFKYVASGPYVRSSYHAKDFSDEFMAK